MNNLGRNKKEMRTMMKKGKIFSKFLNDESGATAIEYGLIAALIGVGIIGGAKALSGSVNGLFSCLLYTSPSPRD